MNVMLMNRNETEKPLSVVEGSDAPPVVGEHTVQFYEDDLSLARTVGSFIADGLKEGNLAMVVATAEHIAAIEKEVRARGVDLKAAADSHQYIPLDARETLSRFMVDGVPDRKLFANYMRRFMERAVRDKRGIVAFGEMVALLCADGNTAGALRLEHLWNGLCQRYSCRLHCAYPMVEFRGPEKWNTFLHICRAHNHILADPVRLAPPAPQPDINLRHLAAIVESSDDAIISKDLNSVITSWNKAAERIFGYTAEEAIGQPITILIPADRVDEEGPIIARVRMGERVDHFETVRLRRDGELVDVALTISPIRDANGRIIGASKIARDISDRKRQERELAESRRELVKAKDELELQVSQRTASLREALAQLEEFSYTVSHDLRAPLRAMQVYSGALLEDFAEMFHSNPEARRHVERINDNCQRLDRMIRDVLTYSRISRGSLQFERISLDGMVADLVDHTLALQQPQAEVKVEKLGSVMGHEPSLLQALSNLLGNAVKFVPKGVKPFVHIWSEKQNGDVRLWIEDNGIGIAPGDRARLFNIFERLHPKLGYEGSGVGLAIVRKALERMRGQVGVESDGVHGSRFWVQLPAAGV